LLLHLRLLLHLPGAPCAVFARGVLEFASAVAVSFLHSEISNFKFEISRAFAFTRHPEPTFQGEGSLSVFRFVFAFAFASPGAPCAVFARGVLEFAPAVVVFFCRRRGARLPAPARVTPAKTWPIASA
jgi:hypothetical protein